MSDFHYYIIIFVGHLLIESNLPQVVMVILIPFQIHLVMLSNWLQQL